MPPCVPEEGRLRGREDRPEVGPAWTRAGCGAAPNLCVFVCPAEMIAGAVTQGGVSLSENDGGEARGPAAGRPERPRAPCFAAAPLYPPLATVRPRALESHVPCPLNLHPLRRALAVRRSQVSRLAWRAPPPIECVFWVRQARYNFTYYLGSFTGVILEAGLCEASGRPAGNYVTASV